MTSGIANLGSGPHNVKQPLKRLEIPIHKFNDVAVPHHVDLLKRHKSNIEKFQQIGNWERVHREQINATRLVKQLKSLLYEMDVLRSQVQESDVANFDKLIASACRNAQSAIQEYIDLNPQRQIMPTWNEDPIRKLTEDDPELSASEAAVERLHEQIQIADDDLSKKEECLKSWGELQTEVQDIHQLFADFAQVVHEQKESVDQIETSVETAAENVTEGATHLSRIKTGMYPLAGALLGGCLGGPVGLMAGLKLGGFAALSCGILGFAGGKVLKKKKDEEMNKFDVELSKIQSNSGVKGSVSLPHIKKCN